MTNPQPYRVLFVCLGNICRSPTAEGIAANLIRERGLGELMEVDSAGTGDWHVGQLVDTRARTEASNHGIALTHHARQLEIEDFDRFDLILAMDKDNYDGIATRQPLVVRAKVDLFRTFDPASDSQNRDVPDPYFGDGDGFANVFEMCRRTIEVLLDQIVSGEISSRGSTA